MRIKLIFLCVFAFVLMSCSDSELENMKMQNSQLQNELNSIKQEMEKIEKENVTLRKDYERVCKIYNVDAKKDDAIQKSSSGVYNSVFGLDNE